MTVGDLRDLARSGGDCRGDQHEQGGTGELRCPHHAVAGRSASHALRQQRRPSTSRAGRLACCRPRPSFATWSTRQEERGLIDRAGICSGLGALEGTRLGEGRGKTKWHKVEKVLKFDTERQYVFGWASVAITKDGHQVEDLQGDLIDLEDLEHAAYEFARDYRSTGVMHRARWWGR